jgi:hypothetical protein
MKEMYLGTYEPEDDGTNSKGGILGGDQAQGDDDMVSRVFLALAILTIIFYLYS